MSGARVPELRVPTPRRRLGAALALTGAAVAVLTALTGCSGSDPVGVSRGDSGGYAPSAPQSAPQKGDPAGQTQSDSGESAPSQPGGASAPTSLLSGDRDLVRRGDLEVEVEDLADAATRARAYVATQGGRISSEQSVLDAGAESTGPLSGSFVQMQIALPPEALDVSMNDLSAIGEVRSRSQSVEDVTLQVVDLESRTASMRASIERVRALMDRAGSISEIVALESELGRREADLESMSSQLAALRTQVAASTLTLTLRAAAPDGPADDDSDEGVLGALTGSLRALGDGAVAILVGVAAALPFAAVAAAAAGAGVLIARTGRRRSRRAVPVGMPGGTDGADTHGADMHGADTHRDETRQEEA